MNKILKSLCAAALCMVLVVIILCLGLSTVASLERGGDSNEIGWSLFAIVICGWLFFKVWSND